MQIIIERGKTVKLDDLPYNSVAIDGFVMGPQIDAENRRFSFDHHGGCQRFSTNCSAMQCFNAVLLGLDCDDLNIYLNDIDLDSAASVWILKNGAEKCGESLVKKMIEAINTTDSHIGGISINGYQKLLDWLAEPELLSRKIMIILKFSNDSLMSILESILHRIDMYINGEIALDSIKTKKYSNFKIFRDQNDFVVVECNDTHIMAHLFQVGYSRVVRYNKQNDNSLCCTLAKRSDFITGFPLEKFYSSLNMIEKNGNWGGSSSCGGSPRAPDGSRSLLSIEEIVETIDNCLK